MYGFLPDLGGGGLRIVYGFFGFGEGGLRIVYGFLPDDGLLPMVKDEAYGLRTDFYRMSGEEAYGLLTDF